MNGKPYKYLLKQSLKMGDDFRDASKTPERLMRSIYTAWYAAGILLPHHDLGMNGRNISHNAICKQRWAAEAEDLFCGREGQHGHASPANASHW